MRAPCELHLVHILDDSFSEMLRGAAAARIAEVLTAVSKEAEEELAKMALAAEERSEIGRIHRHVFRGKPATEILRVARRIGAETIVMGTRGRTGTLPPAHRLGRRAGAASGTRTAPWCA